MRGREYEIIVVDRGSRDGSRAWLRAQPDVRLVTRLQAPGWWPWKRGHGHGEAAEAGARLARHARIVLLDSDAHPIDADWLQRSVDRLDAHHRLAGAVFRSPHRGNPHGWYIHPHFMAFWKRRPGAGWWCCASCGAMPPTRGRKRRSGWLAAGLGIVGHEIAFCPAFDVGHPRVPTVAGGVFPRLVRGPACCVMRQR